ncbi:hypothetical protein EP7_005549 (plasmid) [Isosphaeraceae bacterium EP7]
MPSKHGGSWTVPFRVRRLGVEQVAQRLLLEGRELPLLDQVRDEPVRRGYLDALKAMYVLTVISLLVAVIAARYRGAFCFGFAVFGWGYFLIGIAPWS